MGKYKNYEDFLNKVYPNLYFSKQVQHLMKNGDTRNEAVKKYMERLEKIHENVFSSSRENDKNLLKKFYYENYVIKEENISDNYFNFLDKQYFNNNGTHMTDEMKRIHIENIIKDQRKSLDEWLDYLSSEDARFYPTWAKYWAFQGMITIGAYDNQNQIFKKRTKETVALFVELNREVLAKCIDYIVNLVDNGEINNLEQINGENFSKIYQVLLSKFKEVTFDKTSVDGKWIKYEQGDNYLPLYNSLQGYGTGWCTAGKDTCQKQIKNGDFYVYYTFDENNNPVIPRIAIRMDGQTIIGEIRGVAKGQNVESHLEEVIEEKLKEFPDRKNYEKRISDSKKLTEIYAKYEQNIELNIDELKFIYETERKINGFGYEEDSRITTIKNQRNIIEDYSKIYNINKDEITISKNKWLNNPSKYKMFIGDLDLSNFTIFEGQLPSIVTGNLNLRGLRSAEGLNLSQITIGGNLDLWGLRSAEGLNLSQITIGGNLDLRILTSTEGLVLPQSIGGNLALSSLTSVEGLDLSQMAIGGNLDLKSLRIVKGLDLSQTTIGGNLDLLLLESAEGLNLSQTSIGGDLVLGSVTSVEGLDLSQTTIGGDLYLFDVTSAEDLILPEDFDLDKLFCRPEVKEQLIERKGFKK